MVKLICGTIWMKRQWRRMPPILLDRFLNDAIEVDVDAICDGRDVCIAGIMQHIEQAGVHSGDSACCLPPFSISRDIVDELAAQVGKIAKRLKVIGLMNAQFAIQANDIFVLEVNPRASRTIPFVSRRLAFHWPGLRYVVWWGKV